MTYDRLTFPTRAAGRWRAMDAGLALRLLGLRKVIHPRDVYATLWRDEALCDESIEGNRDYYGYEAIGPLMTDGGLLEVLDLRPAMSRFVPPLPPTDPALPDKWPR